MSMDRIMRQEARLIMLRFLAEQSNGTLGSSMLQQLLDDMFGISRTREWVHQELRYLADIGAVRLTPAASVIIAEITRQGIDHVERRAVLEGVKRPSPSEG
ncbi:VpaChn25_0724 family phage protein [Afifella pfennigii]|uniref:VpaChn25_0724 family phage protein n=1 Tax=Afifella pfennigii TaxID=209897 RepID=UPI00047D1523|nr:hypothetical protein [Afifella pfennigii]